MMSDLDLQCLLWSKGISDKTHTGLRNIVVAS